MHFYKNWFCRQKSPWHKPRWALVGFALVCALAQLSHAAESDCQVIAPGAKVHVVLSERRPEKAFCVHASKGQTLSVKTSRYGDVIPSGHITAPSGESDGAQGETMYHGVLNENGLYRIEAGQRGTKKGGSSDLEVDLK
jgi:hypothetical protein